jgi:targeting protein for Xklp2
MATETKPSSEPPQFQVDEAYEYRAPKYFDFVADETDDQVRAAERWFEAGASHAPSRTRSVPPPPSFRLPRADPRNLP